MELPERGYGIAIGTAGERRAGVPRTEEERRARHSTGLGHELPVVMEFAKEPEELTQIAVKPATTTPAYPLDVFIHEGPAAWPCLEDPSSCGLNGSSSKYGVFQNYLKFAESFKPVSVVVPTAEGEEEEPVPFINFNPFECIIPVQGKPSDILNSGFLLSADVLLPAPALLVFGIRWGGADFILGYDDAACFQEYPCSGTLECVWNIGEEPTLAEFFAMLGEEEVPAPGEYEYAWITGYHIGEEIIITDVLPAVLRVEAEAEEEGIPWGLLLSGGTIAVGSALLL